MTILVTGGAGFLGRSVVALLRERGDRVFVPRSSFCDLRSQARVEQLFELGKYEMVIHLAAHVGGIGANAAQPGAFLYDNALMGLLVMDAARRWQARKFVTVGTVCAYPKYTPVPFRENDLWNGYPEETNAPYGVAKRLLIEQGRAYRAQYAFNAIALLPTNLYGPGDNDDARTSHVIPALIRKCQSAVERGEQTVQVWGSGLATRDFLYVEDAAAGIVAALDSYDGAEPVNLGAGVETSIQELAVLVAKATGFQGEFVWQADKPDGQPRRVLDTERAYTAFGWQARMELQAGLERCVRQSAGRQAA